MNPNSTMRMDLDMPEVPEPESDLVLLNELGRGGMGVVHLAQQTKLQREVALKYPSPEAPAAADRQLLREAWVTGLLEHPNIVPVHDLRRDEQGRPQLVMKRIRGVEWGDLILEDHAKGPLSDAQLQRHFDVLTQVCQAIRYAHNQGILHRDLKPENVMVGAFGEVYVLDWGIAVSMVPDESGRLPDRWNHRMVAGTPLYMAPEQFSLDGEPQSVSTDVYLLAGLLFFVLTGRPPRASGSLQALKDAAYAGVALPEDLPDDLRSFMGKCFATNPHERPTVLELVQALQAHLTVRRARSLVDQARTLRLQLDGQAETMRYRDYGAAAFALGEAQTLVPDDAAAATERDALHEAMARLDLAAGQAASAQTYLDLMTTPPAALVDAVQLAIAEDAARQAHLTQLQEDLSATRGGVMRLVIWACMGVLWVVLPLVQQATGIGATYLVEFVRDGLQAAIALLVMAVFFRAMRATRINRTVAGSFLLLAGARMATALALWGLGAPVAVMVTGTALADAITMCGTAMAVERRALPAALLYAAAAVATGFFPGFAVWILLGTAVMAVGSFVLLWLIRMLSTRDS